MRNLNIRISLNGNLLTEVLTELSDYPVEQSSYPVDQDIFINTITALEKQTPRNRSPVTHSRSLTRNTISD